MFMCAISTSFVSEYTRGDRDEISSRLTAHRLRTNATTASPSS